MKKQILFIIAVFVFAVSAVSHAGEAEDFFSQGNKAYVEGNYEAALSCYRQVMEMEGISASLLYNMANAYYHMKDAGNAMLYYERALYLDPGNADIQANLRMARKDFGLVEREPGKWERFFQFFSLNGWTWMASGALVVFALIFLLRGVASRLRLSRLLKTASAVALCLFVLSGTGIALQYEKMDCGIVTAKGASLLVSPFDTSSKSNAIKDGRIVRIAKTYKDYLLVEESNGKSGWIAKQSVKTVVPDGDLGL